MATGDGKAGPEGKWGIPAAFYRDDPPPPPPSDDPHRVEFDVGRELESVPDWMLMGIPVAALLIVVLHAIVALIVLMLIR